jgi:ferredoxin
MMAMPLLRERGALSPADALAGTSLCLGCGACTAHCKVHIPVGERLAGWRAPQISPPAPGVLAPIEGSAPTVCVLTESADWSASWSESVGTPVAVVRTKDSLGHAAWRLGHPGVLEAIAAHFDGRELVTASGAIEEVARAAGLRVRRLPAPRGAVVFHPCHSGPMPGPGQLACCGRREGFPDREPEAARSVAEENVRLFDGALMSCADEECACWLRAHGARMVGPTDFLGCTDV